MKIKSILTMILTIGLCAGAASAKGGSKQGAGHGGKLDTDGDGLISSSEFTAKSKKPDKAKRRFAKADANHNGQLDKSELSTLNKHGGKKQKAKKHDRKKQKNKKHKARK